MIEQLGVYDPMPNINNERLVSINFDRVRHWLGQNKAVEVTPAVQQLFGECVLTYAESHPYAESRGDVVPVVAFSWLYLVETKHCFMEHISYLVDMRSEH